MLKRLLNPFVWAFTAVYGAAVAVLVENGAPLDDVIGSGVVLGLLLPLVAWMACLGMPTPEPSMAWQRGEWRLMLVLLAWIALFLAFKGQVLDHAQLRAAGGLARVHRRAVQYGIVHGYLALVTSAGERSAPPASGACV